MVSHVANLLPHTEQPCPSLVEMINLWRQNDHLDSYIMNGEEDLRKIK